MGKYLVIWEQIPGMMPANPKEAGAAMLTSTEMVKADIKKGLVKDWGAFLGESKGYVVFEGTEVEALTTMLQYAPFLKFQVHPVATVAQVAEAMKTWMK